MKCTVDKLACIDHECIKEHQHGLEVNLLPFHSFNRELQNRKEENKMVMDKCAAKLDEYMAQAKKALQTSF